MAQDGKIIAFNVDDLKLRQMTSDSTGSTVYGSWLDALGVQSFTIQPEFVSAELPGDGTTLDIFSKLKKLTGQFVIQMDFEVFEVLLGGSAAYTGSSPSEKATYTISGDDLPNYFEFDVQCLYRGGGDAAGGDIHFRIHKAKMTNFQYNLAFEEYATLQVDWEGVARFSDNQFAEIIENETVDTVTAGASDTTAPTVSSTSPADAATGVAITANVTWTFSEAIQFESGQFNLFEVTSVTNTPAVAAAVSYNSSTFVVTLNPTASLTGTKEHVAIAAGVRDLAGNMLAAPSIINFTTV